MNSVAGRMRSVFSEFGGDAILIYNTAMVDSNFIYMSGFTSGIFEHTALLVTKNKMVLLTSELEYQTALSQKPKEMKVVKYSGVEELGRHLGKLLDGAVVGVDMEFLPYGYFRKLKRLSRAKKFVDASKAFSKARLVKDDKEIKCIQKAVDIVKHTFNGIESIFRASMTEKMLAAEFDNRMRINGAAEPSFKTIVAFGKNAALPHHAPDDTKLGANEFVLIDAGARFNNYCSDLTRTFIFKPDKSSRKYKDMKQMIDIVKEAQKLALDAVKPGADGMKAHKAAEDHINAANGGVYRGKFIHSLGHSIGIDVHDGGARLSGYSHSKLGKGMVFSDEPGIYITGFGGVRFEDDLLVTEGGARLL